MRKKEGVTLDHLFASDLRAQLLRYFARPGAVPTRISDLVEETTRSSQCVHYHLSVLLEAAAVRMVNQESTLPRYFELDDETLPSLPAAIAMNRGSA